MSIEAMKQALDALALFASDESDKGQVAIAAQEAVLASLREHMREIKQLRAALEQAGHIPDATKMMQEPDVYGDGNVYRGQRSKDSTTKTLHYTAQPVAWRTFDGEGNYEFRDYEMNENYKDEWDKRNPKHQGWVEPLYTEPPKRDWGDANPPVNLGTFDEGVMSERQRIVNMFMIQHAAAKGRHNYWQVAANLIQSDVASDT